MKKEVKILKLFKMTEKQKSKLLEILYADIRCYSNEKLSCEIDIFTKHKDYTGMDVIFHDGNYPDLCVSHFGYNCYFRTKKGVNKEKYKTLGQAVASLKKLINNYYGDALLNTSNLRFYKKGINVFNLEL